MQRWIKSVTWKKRQKVCHSHLIEAQWDSSRCVSNFLFFPFRNKYGSVQCVEWLLEETSAASEVSNLTSRSALIQAAIQHGQDESLRCLLAYIRDKHLELGEKDSKKEQKNGMLSKLDHIFINGFQYINLNQEFWWFFGLVSEGILPHMGSPKAVLWFSYDA